MTVDRFVVVGEREKNGFWRGVNCGNEIRADAAVGILDRLISVHFRPRSWRFGRVFAGRLFAHPKNVVTIVLFQGKRLPVSPRREVLSPRKRTIDLQQVSPSVTRFLLSFNSAGDRSRCIGVKRPQRTRARRIVWVRFQVHRARHRRGKMRMNEILLSKNRAARRSRCNMLILRHAKYSCFLASARFCRNTAHWRTGPPACNLLNRTRFLHERTTSVPPAVRHLRASIWFPLRCSARLDRTHFATSFRVVDQPQYGYGWMVPFLAAYIFWRRFENAPPPSPPDHRVLAGLLLILVAALFIPVRLIQEANPDWRLLSWAMALSAGVITAGGIYLAGGMRWARHFAFPILFFFVAVPWPTNLEQFVIQGLMRIDALINVEVLNAIGIPAVQLGNVIDVGLVSGSTKRATASRCSPFMVSLFLGVKNSPPGGESSCRAGHPRFLLQSGAPFLGLRRRRARLRDHQSARSAANDSLVCC